jgi:hypothetical protein
VTHVHDGAAGRARPIDERSERREELVTACRAEFLEQRALYVDHD